MYVVRVSAVLFNYVFVSVTNQPSGASLSLLVK
jgi:hypothetical protein